MRQRDIRIQTVTDHRQLFRPETRLLQNEIKGVAGRLPKNSGTAPVDASITLAREPQSGIQPPFSTGQFQSGLTP